MIFKGSFPRKMRDATGWGRPAGPRRPGPDAVPKGDIPMTRLNVRRTAAALLLLLVLTPALAGAAASPRERSALDHWLPGLWSFLTGLWAETGSDLDPNGATVDTGSSLDPSGQPRPDAGSSLDPDGQARPDEGASLDPSGRS